jgi:hypothetical protein
VDEAVLDAGGKARRRTVELAEIDHASGRYASSSASWSR